MKKHLAVLLLLCMAVFFSENAAQAQGLGIAARAGTLGPGVELTTSLARSLNVRLGAHYLSYSHTDVLTDMEVDVRYDAEGTLANGEVILDWHPFVNQFRLSAGAIYNATTADALVTPIESYEIDGRSFSPERIGTLNARVDYKNKVSPYIGMGYGNAVSHLVNFAFDIGMMYTDAPNVDMDGQGMIGPTAIQASMLEDGFKTFRFYPVVSLGLSFGILRR